MGKGAAQAQTTATAPQQTDNNSLAEYEEILGDGDLPF